MSAVKHFKRHTNTRMMTMIILFCLGQPAPPCPYKRPPSQDRQHSSRSLSRNLHTAKCALSTSEHLWHYTIQTKFQHILLTAVLCAAWCAFSCHLSVHYTADRQHPPPSFSAPASVYSAQSWRSYVSPFFEQVA